MHTVLCGAGQNLRMILAYLRVLLCAFVAVIGITLMFVNSTLRQPKGVFWEMGRVVQC